MYTSVLVYNHTWIRVYVCTCVRVHVYTCIHVYVYAGCVGAAAPRLSKFDKAAAIQGAANAAAAAIS